MCLNKYMYATIIVGIMLFLGCAIKSSLRYADIQNDSEQNKFITIKGIASEVKGGYSIGEYFLDNYEIEKYDSDYNLSQYCNKNLEVTGREKEIDKDADPFIQSMQGEYKVIYDIQSIKVDVQDNSEQDDYITIEGTAIETKDGYYLGEYVLEHKEIEKSNAGYILGQYYNKKLKVTGREEIVETPCTTPSGEILQCREGAYKIICNVQSIEVIE